MRINTRPELVVLPNSSTPADRSIEKRRLRKHVVLNEIRQRGPLSRAEISKNLGYNLPSVSSLVDELIGDGLVLEEEARAIRRGRRPIPVQLNERAASVLGIDMGRRGTIAILLSLGGSPIARIERKTPSLKTAKAHAKWAHEIAERVMRECGEDAPPLAGIGVALPGLIIKDTISAGVSSDLPDTIRRSLNEEFDVPVFVENDARMNALGSLWFGTGKQYGSFAVINIGHGIGLGYVLNGSLMVGKQGFAGEIGFVPLGEQGVSGFTDYPDCLENVASGAGLLRKAGQAGIDVRDAAELADLARQGDKKALQIFDEFAEALGRAVATIMNLFDPEAIILSGRVCRSADLFLDRMRDAARRHALKPIYESTEIRRSSLDVDLGPLGAAACVLHRIFHNTHVNVEEVI